MSLLKACLASTLLLSLTACGTSGIKPLLDEIKNPNNEAAESSDSSDTIKVDKNLQIANFRDGVTDETSGLSEILKNKGIYSPLSLDSYKLTIDNINRESGSIDLSQFGNGLKRLNISEVSTVTTQSGNNTPVATMVHFIFTSSLTQS